MRESSVPQSKAERENETYRVEVMDPERERGTEGCRRMSAQMVVVMDAPVTMCPKMLCRCFR